MAERAPYPANRPGWAGWARRNLFSSAGNSFVTLACLLGLGFVIPPLADWAVFNAVWQGGSGAACRGAGADGACWAFIAARASQLFAGTYPLDERWRIWLTLALALAGLAPLVAARGRAVWLAALYLFGVFPLIAGVLLLGGVFGLTPVPAGKWGGAMLTLVVAATGIGFALPFGILLALARQSSLPVLRWLAIAFIELWRGVPLVTVLFIASVVLPLFFADGVDIGKLARALAAIALFASAYMAEVVRGGLQIVGKGQYDAARALGLGYWRAHILIILPQALKAVIPGIVNTAIGLFKDTSLVLVIGLFDLLNVVQTSFADPDWAAPQITLTGYVFAGAFYWVFCASLSAYARGVERRGGGTVRETLL